jgi:hypothetical protein
MAEIQGESVELQFIGYFPKITTLPANWQAAGVAEICSVSNCLCTSPQDWIGHWKHNDWGFFSSVAEARSVVTGAHKPFVVFAYRLLPRAFVKGHVKAYDIPELPLDPIPSNCVSLGFDVVSKSIADFFECSPLSCNHMAAEIAGVNRYCLMNTLEEGVILAERFSIEEPEPGPYYVIEVLREGQGEVLQSRRAGLKPV